jgi:outer membrane protein OmpA-like peptidoglycan-associated protein
MSLVSAQSQIRLDAGTSLGFTTATTSFRDLTGFPSCCPAFESGTGTGGSFGLGVDMPVTSSLFGSMRLSLHDRSHTVSADESVNVIVGNNYTLATIKHSLELPLTEYGLEALIGYRLGNFVFRAGTSYAIRSFGSLRSREEITSPASATFTDTKSNVRNSTQGALPQPIQDAWNVVGVVGLDIPLRRGGAWRLTPEVSLHSALADITSAASWKTITPAIGLRLSYEFGVQPPAQAMSQRLPRRDTGAKPPTAQEPRRQQVQRDTTPLADTIKTRVIIEELEEERFLPVLPYVFFDQNSSVIPERYATDRVTLNPNGITTIVVFHHQLLKVIADRMQRDPSIEITLTGCSSDDEQEQRLSIDRARAVAKIFTSTYGIASKRITIRRRGLPSSPSIAVDREAPLADEENRRVEITSTSPDLLMPYRVADTVMIVKQTDQRGGKSGQRSTVVTVADTIRLFDKRRNNIQDSTVERFDLIVFPFRSAELTSEHQRVLKLVRERIGIDARVAIEGRTDVIGSAEENAKLSLQRANSVARELQGRVSVIGRGEPDPDQSQTLPEERMLSRTVTITATVPMTRR